METTISYGRCKRGAYKGLDWIEVRMSAFGIIYHNFVTDGRARAEELREELSINDVTVQEDDRG
ncbi:MAG: hypothetical protein ACYTG5_23410 [Planctomycetota bacterium]|jgi:hypothetical protein